MGNNEIEAKVLARETAGGLPAALEELGRILEANPLNGEALRLRAKYQAMADDLLAVLGEHRALVAANPASRLKGKLAYEYRWFGNLQASIAEYDREIALEPGDYALVVYRARVKKLAGDLSGARSDLNAAALMSGKAEVWSELAELEAEAGDNEAALQSLDRAAKAQPSWRNFLNRGVFKCKLGRWKEARMDLDAAIFELVDLSDSDEFKQAAFRHRGQCMFMLGDDEALPDLDAAIALKADDALALCLRGAARGDAAGLKDLDESIRIEPAAAFSHAFRGDLHLKLGDKAAALRDYRKAAELDATYEESLKESIREAEAK